MFDGQDSYRQEFRKAIWMAVCCLGIAPVAYLIVASVVVVNVPESGATDMLFYILLVLSMVQPTSAFLIERFHINRYRADKNTRMSPGQLFTVVSTIKIVIVEAVFIYGLVVCFMSGRISRMIWFYAVGFIWAVVIWPRRATFERFLQTVETS